MAAGLGSTVRLKFILTDNWGKRVLYEEPVTITSEYVHKIDDCLDAFATGVRDAMSDLYRDYKYREALKDIPTYILQSELANRED